MLVLYHFGGAICAQKVRTCLAEKGVAWESRIPGLRDADYLKLNPNGYVPTLIHDGQVITESRVICEYINAAFDGPDLEPQDHYERAKVAMWTKQMDDGLHLNVHTLSFAAGFRQRYLAMSPEVLERTLPFDVTKRDRIYDVIKYGFESRFVLVALKRFSRMTEELELALSKSEWIVGSRYTLADVDYTPYMQRLADLGLDFLWDDKPHLSAWFDRVRSRPSFAEVGRNWLSTEELDANLAMAARSRPVFESLLMAA